MSTWNESKGSIPSASEAAGSSSKKTFLIDSGMLLSSSAEWEQCFRASNCVGWKIHELRRREGRRNFFPGPARIHPTNFNDNPTPYRFMSNCQHMFYR